MLYKVIKNPKPFNARKGNSAFFPLTQSSIYAKWQQKVGRQTKCFQIIEQKKNTVVATFQTVTYPLALGRNYIYIPYGPVFHRTSKHDQKQNSNILDVICETLRQEMTKTNSAFCRLDFTPSIDLQKIESAAKNNLMKSPEYSLHSAYFQARKEWVLDLDKSEDALLAGMHEKTRYSIRLGYRKGVESTIVDIKEPGSFEKYFPDFYKLLVETSKRNNFGLHDRLYYESIFKSLANTGTYKLDPRLTNAYISTATYSGKVLATDLIVIYDQMAYYLFGGSLTEERNRMPTYVAMWEAIKKAKSCGAKVYNFGAITAGQNSIKGNPSWSGITEYKMKFGGRALEHSQLVDLVGTNFLDKLIYHLYNIRKYIKNRK